MTSKQIIVFIFLVIIVSISGKYYLDTRGFTPWMTYQQMDGFLKPLGIKDQEGKNFWDRRHWLNGVEGRWHDGQPEFRLRVGDAPEKGAYWWYWWFNQDEKSFNSHIHDQSDDHFKLVFSNVFEWPDGSKRYSGVWHKVGTEEQTLTLQRDK